MKLRRLISTTYNHRLTAAVLATILLTVTVVMPTYALTATQQKIFRYQIYNYDDEVNSACSAVTSGAGSGNVVTTAGQEANAKIVIGIAKTDNLGKEGALIGLMVAITESKLAIYANSNVPLSLSLPHEMVGSDHDSLGIFQQRISTDWSTISTDKNNKDAVVQLMNPAYNAEAFFGSPSGSNAPRQLSKGLMNLSGWQKLDPWVAAQKVQASAFSDGSNYKQYLGQAQSLLTKLWDASPAIPLPVPLSGGTSSTASSGVSNNSCSYTCDTSGSTDTTTINTRQQVVCIAQAELKLWQEGKMKPGTDFHKYSQGRDENWCADFASWVFNQAKYPIDPSQKDGNVPAVSTIKDIGKLDKLFHYHAAAGYTPRPGDLAIHYADGSTSHVNIVTEVKGSNITVIGGNQSARGFMNSSVSQYNLSSPTDDGVMSYVSPD